MEQLTLEKLKTMPPHHIIAVGVTINSPEGILMSSDEENIGKELLWVAKRGGYHDWAIYCDWTTKGFGLATRPTTPDEVCQNGQKIFEIANIRKLIDCDDEALAMYRN